MNNVGMVNTFCKRKSDPTIYYKMYKACNIELLAPIDSKYIIYSYYSFAP